MVVPDVKRTSLLPRIRERVLPASVVYTDELNSYSLLGRCGSTHRRIRHSQHIYVIGDVHTNTIEGYFGLVTGGLRGVYRAVSRRHLQSCLDEYSFRYNHRHTINPRPMFWNFLDQIAQPRRAAA